MHYARSDLSSIDVSKGLENSMSIDAESVTEYQTNAPEHWPTVFSPADLANLPVPIKQQWALNNLKQDGILSFLSQEKQQILSQYKPGYDSAQNVINQMIDLGIVISGPPIKKQTLGEKRKIIKNFDTLVDVHNQWAYENQDITSTIESQSMIENTQSETNFWNLLENSNAHTPVLLPGQR